MNEAEGVVLLAHMTARPGRRDEVVSLLRESLPLIEAHEPDAVRFTIHVPADQPDTVVMYEQHANDEAAQVHRDLYARIPEYAAFRATMRTLLAAPPRAEWLTVVGEWVRA